MQLEDHSSSLYYSVIDDLIIHFPWNWRTVYLVVTCWETFALMKHLALVGLTVLEATRMVQWGLAVLMWLEVEKFLIPW